MEQPVRKQFHSPGLVSLVSGLVKDAFALLPVALYRKLPDTEKKRITSVALAKFGRGEIPDQSPLPYLVRQASLIVSRIYGNTQKAALIPQTIYYEHPEGVFDLEKSLAHAIHELRESNNIERDRYNLALNLLVNGFLSYVSSLGLKASPAPKEGLYLRDFSNSLYCHEEV